MSRSTATWLAWTFWAVTFAILMLEVPPVNVGDDPLPINLFGSMVLGAYATVGALIAVRHPRNAIGWLLISSALLSALGDLALEYAVYGLLTRPGSAPNPGLAAVVGGCLRSVGFFLILTFLLLLFPTGRLPSPRWRPFARLTAIAIALFCAVNTLAEDLSSDNTRLTSFANPLAIISPASTLSGLLTVASLVLILSCAIGCCASVVVRFRRARGVERQQLKWLAYAAVWAALAFFGAWVGVFINSPILASSITFDLCLLGIPLAVGIAILRYRLYDIDIIINRTLVYGSLTIILAALYFGLVIGAQRVTQAFTGQQVGQQPVVIVLTTLLIAALFQPLRTWLQRWIDRRFYRSRYDAAKTVATFSAALRSEVDLAQLNTHLLAVVEETMRPTHVSLWLRSQPRARIASAEQRDE